MVTSTVTEKLQKFQILHAYTDSTVLGITYVCTELVFDSRLLMYNKICFEKNVIEGCSPHLYASFGTFCVQIGQSFRNRQYFPSMRAICRFLDILQRLAVPPNIDRFGLKMCQKKRKDVIYHLL